MSPLHHFIVDFMFFPIESFVTFLLFYHAKLCMKAWVVRQKGVASEESDSEWVKVFSNSWFISADNDGTREYFGWALLYKTLLYSQSEEHSWSSRCKNHQQMALPDRFLYTMFNRLGNKDNVNYNLKWKL